MVQIKLNLNDKSAKLSDFAAKVGDPINNYYLKLPQQNLNDSMNRSYDQANTSTHEDQSSVPMQVGTANTL